MKFFYGDISVTHFIFAVHFHINKEIWKAEICTRPHPVNISLERICTLESIT
jgi:hypothetical protein